MRPFISLLLEVLAVDEPLLRRVAPTPGESAVRDRRA